MLTAFQKVPLRFRPALVDSLKDYSTAKFLEDLKAGLSVSLVAIPLALAFARASGMPPQSGLVTAIVAGFLISALGGSRYQIGGPTGIFIPILAGIVASSGQQNVLICGFLAGIILVLMGMAGLGHVIRYIPYPVTMGFTSGIAAVILMGQIGDFCGLRLDHVEPDFLGKIGQYTDNLNNINGATLAVGLLAVAIVIYWPTKWQHRVPGSMVALVVAGLVVSFLHLHVDTIGRSFLESGGFEDSKLKLLPWLPPFHVPALHSVREVTVLLGPAMTIAILGAIESSVSAMVADGLTNDKHDANQELLAQGIANICTPMFGGLAATGAIARTGTNIRNGAVSPISGMVHALALLIIMLAGAWLANDIPLCALAGVLLVVSFKMGEWNRFARIRRIPRSDALVFLTVFSLTVLTDLTKAVVVGIVLAALLFIKRVSEASEVTALDATHPATGGRPVWADESWPDGVYLFRIQGAFFFGTADMLETSFRRAGARLRVMILLCEDVFSMDATGLNALETLHERLGRNKRHLVLCKVARQPLEVITQSGFLEALSRENLTTSVEDALKRARGLLNLPEVK